MEKEKQKWEQEEVEQEQEEEEASLQVRKSRPVKETKITESAIVETEKSNGTSESNGHEIQSTVTSNGTKDFESTLENGEEKDELDGSVGNEEEISNGLQTSDNLVFFDEDQGNEFTPPVSGDQQIEKSNGHKELDIFSQEFDALHNSVKGGSEGHLNDDSLSYSNHQQNGIQEDDGLSNSVLKSSGEIESEEDHVGPGHELEVTEIDVEQVLQKQTTHDVYCPNCNSRITGRVILRKRKRGIPLSAQDIKRNKLETVPDSKLDVDSFQVAKNDADHDREPDLFRCLSCFSFFFPAGKKVNDDIPDEQVPSTKKNWFHSIFGSNKQGTAVAQGSKSRQDVRKNDVGLVRSSDIIDHNGQPSFGQEAQTPAQASYLPVPKQGHTVKTKELVGAVADETTEEIEETIEHSDAYASDQLQESKSGKEAQMNGANLSTKSPPKGPHFTDGESSEDDISSSKGGMNLLISSDGEFMTFEKPKEGQIPYQNIQISEAADGKAIQIMATPVSVLEDVDGRMGLSLAVPYEDQHVEPTIVTDSAVENKKANFQSGNEGRVYPTEVSQDIATKTKFEVQAKESLKIDDIPSVKGASIVQGLLPQKCDTGKDTVISIDGLPVGPDETNSTLHSASQVTVTDAEGTEGRNEFEIEVIKSIVYGGLAETITSLSVVSSAAATGAATLNILALGIASLIGGIFVICHQLWELRNECIEQAFNNHVSPVIEQRDRYKELLGRKENFVLHAIVSILSFIIFGLVAPVTYGFSFSKSDNKEFKLIVVAAASLLCISGLAVGRAYVRRPPKPYVKSVVTYVISGFMASGVSYVAGVLVERILEKLGLFHSSSGANLLLSQMETVPSYSGWTSY